MATPITVTGNLTKDPELRISNGGNPWATMTVAVSHRSKNAAGEVQESTDFWDCKLFGSVAENVAASLTKGSRVIVSGTVRSDSWTDQASGQKRSKMVIYVDEAGPSLRWATAEVQRTSSGGGAATAQYAGAGVSSNAAPAFADDENPFM